MVSMKNSVIFFLLLLCSVASAQSTDTSLGMVSSFLVKSEYGKTVDVAALKGKVVFINFWALTCAPLPGGDAHYRPAARPF